MKNILIIVLLASLFISIYNKVENFKSSQQYINSSMVKACSYDMSKGMISECD